MGLILLIVLVLLVLGTLPTYGYSRDWGFRPSGLLGLLVIVLLVLLLLGTIPWGFSRRVYVVDRTQPVVIDRRPVIVHTPPAGTTVQPQNPPSPSP